MFSGTQEIGCPLLKCNQIGVEAEAEAEAEAGDDAVADAVAELQTGRKYYIFLWPAPSAGQEETGHQAGLKESLILNALEATTIPKKI